MPVKGIKKTYDEVIEGNLTETHPYVCEEWDYERNFPLRPENITSGNSIVVHWKCRTEINDHLWKTTTNSRTHGSKCPCCSNKKVVTSNSLLTTHKLLCNEWDYERNFPLRPEDFTATSSKTVYWLCSKHTGYSWRTRITRRTTDGNGCRKCAKMLPNNLAETNSDICKQWDYTRNFPLVPENFNVSSFEKVFWICSKDSTHSWDATIRTRVYHGSDCPICSGMKTFSGNSIVVTHNYLLDEWHPSLNKDLKPEDFKSGSSHDVIWWRCKTENPEHVWDSTINNRTSGKGQGCPYCSGQRVCSTNNLAYLRPDIAKEWNILKNNGLTPLDVTKSSTKPVWWICEHFHEWTSTVSARTSKNNNGCKVCNGKKYKGEVMVEYFLKTNKINKMKYEPQKKFNDCKGIASQRKMKLAFDFAVYDGEKLFCLIEFDGKQHFEPVKRFGGEKGFKKVQTNDAIKNKYCEDNGIYLIRIPYWDFKNINQILTEKLSSILFINHDFN
jgi:hypothetical protein